MREKLINYIDLRLIYVNMQLNYINIQNNSVDMGENYVACQHAVIIILHVDNK